MKKVIAAVLVIFIMAASLTGCGSKSSKTTGSNSKSNDTATAAPENTTDNSSSDSSSDSDKVVEGSELSTFINEYLGAKSKVWDAMSKKLEENQNMAFAMGSLGFAFADMLVIEIELFDVLTVKSGDMYKGKLMFTDIEAWKKVKGDVIEFGYDYTYPEDKNQNKKGDHEVTNGRFNKKNKSITYTHYTQRDGKKVLSYLVQITQNSDKSYTSQMCTIGSANDGSEGKSVLSGYFTWFEGEDIISLLAEKENAGFDFEYVDIYGKKNVKPEEMAKGFIIKNRSSFIGGKASYEDLSKK